MTNKEIIAQLESIESRAIDFPYMTANDWVAIAAAKRKLNPNTAWNSEEELKTYFPIDVLNNEEIEHCQKLSKNGYISVVKYLKNAHPKMGLKEAKIYYDLYFNN